MNTARTHLAPKELMSFFDDELPAEEMKAISVHIHGCKHCTTLVSQLKTVSDHLSTWVVEPTSLGAGVIGRTGAPARPRHLCSFRFSGPPLARPARWGLGIIGLAIAVSALTFVGFMRNTGYERRRAVSTTMPLIPAPPDRVVSGGGAGDVDLRFDKSETGRETLPQQRERAALSEQLEKTDSDLQMSSRPLPAPLPQAPMIARSVSLSVMVKDFPAARIALDDILARHHGYAADLKASTGESSARSLTASLRVPANDLVPTMTELKTLGRVQEETQNGEEVTQQHVDLVARLKNSRETEQRLQAILANRTGKMSDVLEVEQEISRVRGEIEELEAELKNLNHRVEFAIVNLTLNEEYQASISNPPLSAGTRLRNAAVTGFRNARETLLGILLFFAENGLVLAMWLSIFIIPAVMLWRRYRRALASIETSAL